METDGRVEKQSTVFPHVLAKRLGAFCTVPTGFTAVNPQTTKPDISLATKTGHFHLLPTLLNRGLWDPRELGEPGWPPKKSKDVWSKMVGRLVGKFSEWLQFFELITSSIPVRAIGI